MGKRKKVSPYPSKSGIDRLLEQYSLTAREIVITLTEELGTELLLKQVGNPFFIHTFAALLGLPAYGKNTTVLMIKILQKAINPMSRFLDMFVVGGTGEALETVDSQLTSYCHDFALDSNVFSDKAKLALKADSIAIQDGMHVFIQGMFISRFGSWAMIHEGRDASYQRRYYFRHSGISESLITTPYTGIIGKNCGEIIDLTSKGGSCVHETILNFCQFSLHDQLGEIEKLIATKVIPQDFIKMARSKRLSRWLDGVRVKNIETFSQFILLDGLGSKTLALLTTVCDHIYGTKSVSLDPAEIFTFDMGDVNIHSKVQIFYEDFALLKSIIPKINVAVEEKKRLEKNSSMVIESMSKGGGSLLEIPPLITTEEVNKEDYLVKKENVKKKSLVTKTESSVKKRNEQKALPQKKSSYRKRRKGRDGEQLSLF